MQRLLKSDQMRDADSRATAAGTPGFTLMIRAGEAAAEAAARMLPEAGRVLVLCGPGNNGGDGFVVSRLLANKGHNVTVAAMKLLSGLTGDAAEAGHLWGEEPLPLAGADPAGADLVIDALFGTGLARDLDGEVAALIARVNAAGRPVLAIDIPSGIDADSGLVRGAAVRADRTITFACRKPGHLLQPGRAHAGIVEVADIGVSCDGLSGPTLFANGQDLWRKAFPRPGETAHKYDRGHALVVSGGPANTGAARLAARGALRTGAGLVSVVTSARALSVNAAHLTAIMMRVCDDPDEFSDLLTDDRFNALALGPALGVGETTRRWVETALEADRATVLDADALTSFSGSAEAFAALTRAPRETPVVLTPHEGELKRLLAGSGEASAEARAIAARPSKLERALGLASFTDAFVILKGADTVIASPQGRAAINLNGSAYLGTAGSGDVLGGIVAGLMAQGMPGFEAAACAVWMHAEAGAGFGPGLIAEDLPELLPRVMQDVLA
ncbi:NAD(P)H-hydrate dehydratase [Enterovirga sp. CN4-39]|uniref:NAD(P)H-hydrate dehydratase n=1 Tax=Enterovirga sp. CN4-39 TaxID=3400910 RepID=UPI003BFAD8D3